MWMKLKHAAEMLGAAITGGKNGRWYRYCIDAPEGYIWNATGDTSTLVVEWLAGDPVYKEESVADAFERVSMGIDEADSE